MRLHLLGLPHTITRAEYSHCAFTGKIQRFSPMMRGRGYHVTHYGVEGAASGANEQIAVLEHGEWEYIKRCSRAGLGMALEREGDFVGDLARTDSLLYRVYNAKLRELLRGIPAEDIICLPFGHAHQAAVIGLPNQLVETGIGYHQTFTQNRVFESYAWQAYRLGHDGEQGHDYTWVIPNYYDLDEWPEGDGSGGYLLFFGRICQVKGLDVIREIAKRRPRERFLLCGQGDPTPWLAHNVEAVPPVHGRDRARILGAAKAILAPSRYLEPFCGSVVEAALCGTPAITSNHGAFGETVVHNETGYRCNTLADWLDAVDRLGELDRRRTRCRARRFYDMHTLSHKYDKVFRQVDALRRDGWFAGAAEAGMCEGDVRNGSRATDRAPRGVDRIEA